MRTGDGDGGGDGGGGGDGDGDGGGDSGDDDGGGGGGGDGGGGGNGDGGDDGDGGGGGDGDGGGDGALLRNMSHLPPETRGIGLCSDRIRQDSCIPHTHTGAPQGNQRVYTYILLHMYIVIITYMCMSV